MSYLLIDDLQSLVAEVPAESIISRRVYQDEHVNITLFGFAAGQELTEHTAARPASLHFLAGEAALTLEKDTVMATAGTWVYMPAHLPHSVRANTAVTMLLTLYGEG